MAGGSGTRLWPASSSARPKQFLPISKNAADTFFSLSLKRAFNVIKKDGEVIVIAGKSHIPLIIEACSALNVAEKQRLVLIPEAQAKNTAPAIACALAYSGFESKKTMLVLTSDHIIKPPVLFKKNAATAARYAAQNKLVVFGITPSRPETGYGYIKSKGKSVEGVFTVAEFREKPDPATAKKFAASRRYFWNSGMFAFNCGFLTEEFRSLAADVIRPFEQLLVPGSTSFTTKKNIRILDKWTGLDNAYRKTKSISFDYAIAVACTRTVMVRADFDWIDIGSWDEYARLLGNGQAEVYSGGTSNGCFVDSDIPVALAGVEDLIIVIRSGTNGSPCAALIAKKGKTQAVREIVAQIKQSGRGELL